MQNWSTLRDIGLAAHSLRGYIWIFWTVVPTVVVAIGGFLEGFTCPWMVVLIFSILAATSFFVYYGFRSFDYVVAKIGVKKENNRVATILNEARLVGHATMSIESIAREWAADEPSFYIRNAKLRKLKAAVTQGKVTIVDGQTSPPNKNTSVRIDDVIELFRSGDIDKLQQSADR